jgi:hypothetical protein
MMPAIFAMRRFAAAAAIASLGLYGSPAWSTCSPEPGKKESQLFRADDGVVFATSSGLTWQRCSLGQHFDDGSCRGTASQVDWAAAKSAAAAAGHGWRLPTQTELQGLLLGNCNSPATDANAFPGTHSGWYWSSTADGPQGAWFVDFEQGGGGGATVSSNLAAVRLVRHAGQPGGDR